jgi:thiol-disulfide isomerase/thioredoxin
MTRLRMLALLVVAAAVPLVGAIPAARTGEALAKDSAQFGFLAPELEGGTAWFNTGKPIKLKDLRGKIVMLDFWTFCCINCMHIMPELAKLEAKYKNELVVIGVHSGKFENEKDNEAIRKAVLRYELKHPVVNDSERKIWNAYKADWWPTIAIIDPDGVVVAGYLGETNFDAKAIDKVIAGLVAKHKRLKTLDETPIRFDTAKFRDKDEALYFPGKIVVDAKGQRLLIADSTHHRVVITDMNGKKIAIAGTGHPGNKDGAFATAQFDDPQGMAVDGDLVYLADRKNNCVRTLDLKTQTVKTIPNTTKFILKGLHASPWDVHIAGGKLFVAMSGAHQIWALDLKTKAFTLFAGDATEEILDGPLLKAKFAQPSGLTSDGRFLYVADSEVSAVRKIPLSGGGAVETLVGRGLFIYGDRDGPGRVADPEQRKTTEALLQHATGVAHHEGKLYVADTYNSKIRVIDLETGVVSSFVGGGDKTSPNRVFNEPMGLSIHDGKLYVADTNAHRIRIVDLKTKDVKTLELTDVPPVEPPKK